MRNILKTVCIGLLTCSLVGCATVEKLAKDLELFPTAEKEEPKQEKKSNDVKDIKVAKKIDQQETPVVEEAIEVSISDLLNNGEQYDGKKVRVNGFIPKEKIVDVNGREMFGLMEDDKSTFVELTGKEPEDRNCKAWVNGVAKLVDGEIVIEATDFEVTVQYVEVPVVVEQDPAQQEVQPQDQKYYYHIVNGKYVFDTPEGQRIWDSKKVGTEEDCEE